MSFVTRISEPSPRYRAAWLGLGWLLVLWVTVASLVPAPSLPDVSISDKLNHFLAYGTLGFVFLGALGRRRWPAVLGGLALLGAGLELAQAAGSAGRTGELLDMVANLAGTAAGIALAAAVPGGWCCWVEDRMAGRGGAGD